MFWEETFNRLVGKVGKKKHQTVVQIKRMLGVKKKKSSCSLLVRNQHTKWGRKEAQTQQTFWVREGFLRITD